MPVAEQILAPAFRVLRAFLGYSLKWATEARWLGGNHGMHGIHGIVGRWAWARKPVPDFRRSWLMSIAGQILVPAFRVLRAFRGYSLERAMEARWLGGNHGMHGIHGIMGRWAWAGKLVPDFLCSWLMPVAGQILVPAFRVLRAFRGYSLERATEAWWLGGNHGMHGIHGIMGRWHGRGSRCRTSCVPG